MRLICPNCDAQYEVPDDVMPVAGRDVQCSNCGQTWFQHHPDKAPVAEDELSDAPAPDEETAPPPPPPPSVPPKAERRQLDPAVADILRQEAEAEQAARRATSDSSLETQPDLGMDLEDSTTEQEADRRARQARARMARMRGTEAPSDDSANQAAQSDANVATAALGSRRDLLPDIDEINSTLRSGSARSGLGGADVRPTIESPSQQRKRRGFRTGFFTVLLIFAILAIVYVMAPRLATTVPALDGPLQSYVMWVDQGRSWLDSRVQSILQTLDSVAEDSNS
jgi:predicted Zn finger-like uncharacterized protein